MTAMISQTEQFEEPTVYQDLADETGGGGAIDRKKKLLQGKTECDILKGCKRNMQ